MNRTEKMTTPAEKKINALENENRFLKNKLHELLEIGDDISVGKFEEEENKTIENLEKLNYKLKVMVLSVIKDKYLIKIH
jgi:hypothetical protein